MCAPESDLTWTGTFDYAVNSPALTDNDANPGVPVDVRELFVQKVTDVAKVERRQYHIGGWLHERLEWQEPSATSESQGWIASSDGWTSARRGQAPPIP